MFRNYLKIAIRNLFRNKIGSLINVLGLSLGISACITMLLFVEYESSFDAFHKNADRTFRVVQHTKMPNETLYWNTTAYPLAEALRSDFPEFETVTQVSGPETRIFKITDSLGNINLFEESGVLFADNFYPKVFDVAWVAGNKDNALSGTASVVLTEELVQKYFHLSQGHYQDALGRTIMLQGKDPLTVTGVIKGPRGNSDHQYTMLIPYEFFRVNNSYYSSNWAGNYQGTTFTLLGQGTDKDALESKIDGWKKKYLELLDDQRIQYHLQPLKQVHNENLYGPSPGGYILPKNILDMAKVVALFVLLIALVNFVNLVTAQSHTRHKEVGVRKVMGSHRWQLIQQSFFENGLVIGIAALLSMVLVRGAIQFLNTHFTLMDLKLVFLPGHFIYILLVAVLAIVLGGLYPALVFSASNPVNVLKGKVQLKRNKTVDLRKGLVTVQFVIVQLFVIGAIILAFQLNHFRDHDLGFSKETTVITEIPDTEKRSVFEEKLLADTHFSEVAIGSGPPMAVSGFRLGTRFRQSGQA
ncbi:MAG: ABC transporter permease, partial [Bacteroidota bacterium]